MGLLSLHKFFLILALPTVVVQSILASPLGRVQRDLASDPPTVNIDNATLTGVNQNGLSKFLGIPFAQPPVGTLRFSAPLPVPAYSGSLNGTSYGAICPQQTVPFPVTLSDVFNVTIPDILKEIVGAFNLTSGRQPVQSEDCLTINVIKPPNVSSDAKLPVLVWIFGGGFERGSAQAYDEQGMRLVNRSIELGEPVIYAAMNYRVSAWGFLASKEVEEDRQGNMGLQDQRLALEWVQQYIHLFGGDPTKVTIWGQSAGAISASMQMLAYGGNITSNSTFSRSSNTNSTSNSTLFRGAFLQSGSPIPVGNLTGGQEYYDMLVNYTNCSVPTTNSGAGGVNGNGTQAFNSTLECLRQVPLDTLKEAVDTTPNYFSYSSLVLAWSPRADGRFLQENPQKLVQDGKVANVSLVSGDVDDEGTLFSLSSRNVTTDPEFEEYISTIWVPDANSSTLDPLWTEYPSEPRDGSPFNTSVFNAITPQYKRIAAFQGDVVFQAPRRFFLQHLVGEGSAREEGLGVWSYLSRRLKLTPVLGSFHGSDMQAHVLDDYIVRFTNTLDPNNGTGPEWPQYTTDSPQLYTFPIAEDREPSIENDTYREQPMQFLMNLSLSYPL